MSGLSITGHSPDKPDRQQLVSRSTIHGALRHVSPADAALHCPRSHAYAPVHIFVHVELAHASQQKFSRYGQVEMSQSRQPELRVL